MEGRERLVLIVDDSPEDRDAVCRYLRQDTRVPCRVLAEATAAGGLAVCRSAALDCLLLDYDMPDMNGVEFMQRLTAEGGPPPFPVVMLTGRGSEAVAVQVLKGGAQDYLPKSGLTREALSAAVSEAIGKFAARPGLERQRAEAEQDHREAHEAARRGERLVLILDDSADDRAAARRFLSRDPRTAYRFVEEADGAEGLAVCRSAGLDCLLLDYSLPDMTGLEFLGELTGGTGLPPFPVVMLTGRGDESVAVRALKGGAQDYLIKGKFTDEVLRRTVDNAIASVAGRRALERERLRALEVLEREARARADELVEMDRRKNDFLAMLAHELRNPLAPIRNALHIMEQPGADGPTLARARELAQRQVGIMARLVDDLLEVSRITRGKVQLCKEQVELAPVVSRAVEATRALVEKGGHELDLQMPESAVLLDADAVRLEQIVVNLLNNAAKYTPHGGQIWLSARREAAEAVIRVRDNGVGIEADMLPRVFDLFAQVDHSLSRSQGGMGIGLTLVHSLAQMHGGSVQAASDGLGRGSEFTVRLPALPEKPRQAPPPKRFEGGPREITNRPLDILLVEDNVEGAETVATLLRLWGHRVRVAHDGTRALESAAERIPELVLLDIGLPRMSGYEVARHFRDEKAWGHVPLVALTGYGQAEARRRSHEAGFDLHLVKPVDPRELEHVLANFDHLVEARTRVEPAEISLPK